MANLKTHSSWSHLRTVDRASQRVSSWPQWKKSSSIYRNPDSPEQTSVNCKPQTPRDSESK